MLGKQGKRRSAKHLAFGTILSILLAAATLAGIEALASFFVPDWPARAMNPRGPWQAKVMQPPFERQQWLGVADNSWGMRDRERSFVKKSDVRRAVFVGDSFVESRYTRLSLPAAVQRRVDRDETRVEAINLGVGATDPRSYYFRIRDVALAMQPDVLLVFFYAGNDFMAAGQGYSAWPRLVDESPGGSLLGWVMPRTNWLAVNRLNLSDLLRSRAAAPPDDDAILFRTISLPRQERLQRMVEYVRRYIDPAVPDAAVAEILTRGDQRLLDIALPQEGEQEYLLDWVLRILFSWEASDLSTSEEHVKRSADRGHVTATLSWIEAIERLAREHHVPMRLFLIPMGSVDPDYRAFWSPWPRAYLWNRICAEWQSQLVRELGRQRIDFVDLTPDLAGIPGTYRKLDGHWTEKGEAIVAERVARELESMLRH